MDRAPSHRANNAAVHCNVAAFFEDANTNPSNPAMAPILHTMALTATPLTLELYPFETRGPSEFEAPLPRWPRGGLTLS